MTYEMCPYCQVKDVEATCYSCGKSRFLGIYVGGEKPVITEIEVLGMRKGQEGELQPLGNMDFQVKYKGCPFCGGFLVTEIGVSNKGLHEAHYDMKGKTSDYEFAFAGLNPAEDELQTIDYRCGSCNMPIPSNDQLDLIQESEEWLPQPKTDE